MEIQAIIKQVISLAGIVIKNPSTSVKSSGIDFGSLINIAGSMMGKNTTNSQSGGLDMGSLINIAGSIMGKGNSSASNSGNVLGSILGGLTGNQSNTPNTAQQNNDGGGLGSILGGLAEMATGKSSQQNSGGMGDILGGLAKAGLGNAVGNMFSKEEASSLMTDVSSKEKTITDMLQNQKLNTEEKNNLSDMLGLLKVAGSCLS